MKITQLVGYSRNLLKGRKTRAFFSAFSFAGTIVFFRFAEAAAASTMLYCTGLTPFQLFSPENIVWQLFFILCLLLKCAALSPIMPSCALRFTKLCGNDVAIKNNMSVFSVISDARLNFRSFFTILAVKIVSLIFMLPVGFFLSLAVNFINNGSEPINVFYAVHCVAMTLTAFGVWIWAVLGMTAVPFAFLKFPNKNIIRIIAYSFRIMKNRRFSIIKLTAIYIPSMIFIATIPWLLTEFFMSVSLYINISIKELEYIEWTEIHSQNRVADNSSKLSAWLSGRLKTPSYKAETAGKRNYP